MTKRPPAPAGASYARAIGTITAFLVISVFVKYSELLFTFDHRALVAPQGTVVSRLKQIWLSLRFSWQEFAVAAVLLAAVLMLRRAVPHPGRAMRAALGTLRAVLTLGALVNVLGIAYYALYHTHPTRDDFAHIGWAAEIAGSADVFQYVSIRIGLVLWAVAMAIVPWMWARLPPRTGTRLAHLAVSAAAMLAVVTGLAGRPQLSQARLEPHPLLWLAWGERASYLGLPPIDRLATTGEPTGRFEPTTRPRNLILLVLESTPASALFGYNPDAEAGRRLYTAYGDDITQFDRIYAVSPNSVGSLLSVLTGWSPVPNNAKAFEASHERPTLAETLKAHGLETHFLLTGPSDPMIDALLARGFDRAWSMDAPWPTKARHVRIPWGYDDRMLFEEAAAFLDTRDAGSPPFFLMLHASVPHHPYSAELVPGLEGHEDPRVRHGRLVKHLMELTTTFYEHLQASGLADSTAVLAYGDHGEAFGEREGNFIHSKELYRENVHVPLLLLHPNRLGLPRRIGQVGTLDDIMPTVLDLLGIPAPGGSGMSLLLQAPQRTIFTMTDWGPGQIGFRDHRYFYSLSRTGREQLFDVLDDPAEQHDIAASHPDVVERFRNRLTQNPPP